MAFAPDTAVGSATSGALLRPVPLAVGDFRFSDRLVTVGGLVLADILALQVAVLLGTAICLALGYTAVEATDLDPLIQAGALVMPLGYCFLGIYRIPGRAPIESFPLRIKTTCLLFALLVILARLYGVQWPLPAAGLSLALATALQVVGEGMVRRILIRTGRWGIPAVVVGSGPTGQQLIHILNSMPELGLRPVALFGDSQDSEALAWLNGVPVMGSIAEAARYSRQIETAIVITPTGARQSVDEVAGQLGYRDIIVVPDLRDLPSLWLKARDLNGLIGLQMRRNLLLRRNRVIKRTIDYLVALPLCVVSAPLVLVLALWIKLRTDGSPFYVQARAGEAGRTIKVWKLRTMYPDADERLERHLRHDPAARAEWERYCKLRNDPRIVPGIGNFLRRTSLDELPQIFNVIRGEMSLVGPRPFPSYHLDRFDASFRALRASVIPGITGLWQISARSDGDLQVQQALDTYYIRNWSIWIDLYILSRTLGAVVAGRGAR